VSSEDLTTTVNGWDSWFSESKVNLVSLEELARRKDELREVELKLKTLVSMVKHAEVIEGYKNWRDNINARERDPAFRATVSHNIACQEQVDADYRWFKSFHSTLYGIDAMKPSYQEILVLHRALCIQWNSLQEVLGLAAHKDQPIVVWLKGKPGMGKSDTIHIICKYIMDAMKQTDDPYWTSKDYSSAMLYSKPATSSFFQGYRSQPFYLMDDLFQVTDAQTIASNLSDFITLVNTAPAPLDMADVESKGKVFFNSPVIFVTSNVINLMACGS